MACLHLIGLSDIQEDYSSLLWLKEISEGFLDCDFLDNLLGLSEKVSRRLEFCLSQCWGCLRYSKEEPSKMCFYSEEDPMENRGCRFVNKLFDESE